VAVAAIGCRPVLGAECNCETFPGKTLNYQSHHMVEFPTYKSGVCPHGRASRKACHPKYPRPFHLPPSYNAPASHHSNPTLGCQEKPYSPKNISRATPDPGEAASWERTTTTSKLTNSLPETYCTAVNAILRTDYVAGLSPRALWLCFITLSSLGAIIAAFFKA